MLLTRPQAHHVHSAMLAMRDVSGTFACVLNDGEDAAVNVRQTSSGGVTVESKFGLEREHHADRLSFFKAYGLHSDEPKIPLAYNQAGHVCPTTGRIAMTVAEAYARDDAPDRTFYLHSKEAADDGLECWRLIEGMDAEPGDSPGRYTIDFPSGHMQLVEGRVIVYMQRTRAEKAEEAAAPTTALSQEAIALIQSCLSALRDVDQGYPWKEMHVSVPMLLAQAKALGVILDD